MRIVQIENLAAVIRLARELMATEARLVSVEIRETRARIVSALAFAAVSGVLWLLTLFFVALAAIAWLVYAGFAVHVATSIVAAGLLFLAIVATLIAVSRMKQVSLSPRRSLEQMKRDAALLESVTDA